ncbi:MFS transporter [Staphylococcus massiliensis]|uniref:multidrug efflux MFS transporter SdrM n=1 Tax=Staphylococcus massiliensis TaxID=555791 RepID=UPI001EDE302C|nr:multidrug efflux MFS transporter SdrM [Staphylococcus massiliensis]MCG3402579.1 MFS transporter [Staphylococcus massiliensis]
MKLRSLLIVISLLLIMFMAAIETSIITLALPSMKEDLHIEGQISLVFAVYFIAMVLATPIIGEIFSRSKVIYVTIGGLILFTLGSLFAGLSPNFAILILSRFIQGIGSGVLMSLTQIIPKLAFDIPLRYKVMGVVGSMWGVASLVGPLLGGFILEIASWHWLFYINIPIAIIAFIIVLFTYHFENETIVKNKLDYKGIILLYALIGFLLMAILTTGMLWLNILGFILFIVTFIALVKTEQKHHAPFIPVQEFSKRINLAFFTDFVFSIVLMGFSVYMPIYLQEDKGLSPIQSGLTVFPISLAWMTITFVLNKIEAKLTLKALYLGAFTTMIICSVLFIFSAHYPLLVAAILTLSGASFGTVYTKDSVIIQEESSKSQMKRMMSLYILTKNLGNAIGSTLMGYVYGIPLMLFSLSMQNIAATVILICIFLIVIWSLVKLDTKH